MLRRHALTICIVFLFCTFLLVVQLYRPQSSQSAPWPLETTLSQVSSNGSSQADNQNLTRSIRYACQKLSLTFNESAPRSSVTKIDAPLFEGLQTIEITEGKDGILSRCNTSIRLSVPTPPKARANASHIMFGIQTTMERLNSSTPHLIRWLSHTGGRLHVVVIESEDVPADRGQMVSLQKSMRSVGLDVILHAANKHDTFPQRYFSLINILYRNRHPDTHWIGLIDDDTFFPSMSALISKLSGFDPQQQYYIGTLSEDWWAVSNYGYMAFGGGGIFLSIPLANILDANTGTCKDHIGTSAGDIAVMDCVYAHTTTKLTHIPELHQVDIFGDLSGLYESGRLPLSLHHWKGGSYFGPDGNGYPLEKMHLVSEICGDCFLQRWQFGDDTILSNGFSIAAYPRGHLTGESPVDLEKIEETWHGNTLFRHSLGPTRPRLALEDEKLQHTLVDSMLTASGVRQLYKRNGVDGDIDTVLELFWTLDAS